MDPSGHIPVRLGEVEFVGNFDTAFIFVGWGEGVEVMQFSKFLLLIRCVWAVEEEGSTVQTKCVLTG